MLRPFGAVIVTLSEVIVPVSEVAGSIDAKAALRALIFPFYADRLDAVLVRADFGIAMATGVVEYSGLEWATAQFTLACPSCHIGSPREGSRLCRRR